jgi:N-acetylglucosaminyldiphosphoundecaprenol N-acetyl-beta-D-mannosaminyltransferase
MSQASLPPRVSVIGSQISVCDRAGALQVLRDALTSGQGGYMCFTSVHGTVMGRQDARFLSVTNNSLLSVADGKPVYWVGRCGGGPGIGHLPGPDFMPRVLESFADKGHFFYGSTPEVLEALVQRLRSCIPGIKICGTLSPPFRQLSSEEIAANYAQIRASGAAFVWVGLGAPKQEYWMADSWQQLSPAILMGVGAAFDFNACTLRRAPLFWRRLGLEWLYRLSQEPRRLWKRYLVITTSFAYFVLRDSVLRRPKNVQLGGGG